MPTQIFDGGPVDRLLGAMHVHDGVADRIIQRASVFGPDGVDRIFYSTSPPLSVACVPAVASGGGIGSGTIDTESTIATPAGGTGPYSYAWTLISHTSATPPTALSPTAASTSFRQTGIGPGDNESAVFRVTVTDSLSAVATADVTAAFVDFS